MPKGLRLKKTPAEQVERDMRKARRAAKKAAHRQYRTHDADLDSGGHSSRRSRTGGDKGDDDLEPPFLDPGPSTPHYNAHTVPVEEESFQEKLWDALRDDERLDGVEARLNGYTYIPRRWRGVSSLDSSDTVGGLGDDPNLMNDDEYAEWMRAGMWRRSNAAVHREKERQRAARAAAKAEAVRILKAEEDARQRSRFERERMRHANARDAYERRWDGLLDSESKSADLGFGDIPWPVQVDSSNISQITVEAVSSFLFHPGDDEGQGEAGRGRRARKEELRGIILRFHPDKFEGRVIPRVKIEEREVVREGANAVTRAVTALMGGKLDGKLGNG